MARKDQSTIQYRSEPCDCRLKVVTVTDKIAEDFEIPTGVYIKETLLDSPALEAGLQNGDVIVAMNGAEVSSVEEYQAKVLEQEVGSSIEITVKRQGMEDYIELECSVVAGKLQ